MISTPYPAMEEDDDWLNDTGPNQGGATDPLTNVEYDRIASKYSDAGYREGITDGKLTTLQEGFDSSFSTSVTPSRRLGNLRGKAAALLALHTIRSSPTNLDKLKDYIRDLNRVKRVDILSIDKEREEHERDEHGEGGYELDGNDKRDMEGLENALDNLGTGGGGKREEELLEELEGKLDVLERELGAITA